MLYGSKSDVGCVREKNEDSFALFEGFPNADLVIVADGMGGHRSGDVASKMAIESIRNHLQERFLSVPILRESIEIANRNIFERAQQDQECVGMGTTLVLAMLEAQSALIANVGDSRAYHFAAGSGALRQVTMDHSLVQELLNCGEINEQKAKNHPYQNVITRALGTKQSVDIDFFEVDWAFGDSILLCSDGLTRYISEPILTKKLLQNKPVQTLCDDLVAMAKQAGGQDNITVVVAQNTQGGGPR